MLRKETFYQISGLTSNTAKDYAVESFLESFKESLEEQLDYVFSLTPQIEENKHNFIVENTGVQDFISIGAWQETGLTIKKGQGEETNLDTLTSTPLILGQDYEVFRFKGGFKKIPSILEKSNSVVAIKLTCGICPGEFLRVYGTYGFSEELPKDLESLIYTAVKNAVQYNGSSSFNFGNGGSGSSAVSSIREYTTTVNFSNNSESEAFSRNYFLDFLNTPTARSILSKYELQFNQTNFFI